MCFSFVYNSVTNLKITWINICQVASKIQNGTDKTHVHLLAHFAYMITYHETSQLYLSCIKTFYFQHKQIVSSYVKTPPTYSEDERLSNSVRPNITQDIVIHQWIPAERTHTL